MEKFNINSINLKDKFSKILRHQLRKLYGKVPSATFVANEFNLRSKYTAPITQESARRWIRGLSLPEDERLKVLVSWLKLDLNSIFNDDEKYQTPSNLIKLLGDLDHKQIDLVIKIMSELGHYSKS